MRSAYGYGRLSGITRTGGIRKCDGGNETTVESLDARYVELGKIDDVADAYQFSAGNTADGIESISPRTTFANESIGAVLGLIISIVNALAGAFDESLNTFDDHLNAAMRF